MSERLRGARPWVRLSGLLQSVISHPPDLLQLSMRDLDLVFRAMRRVRLLGWLASRIEEAGLLASLPDAAVEQLESALAVTDSRARMARWELDRIAWALGGDDAPRVLVLKGCAYLLQDLPNARGRLFADVDLMVAERDLEMVEAALARHGWKAAELSPYDERFYRAWSHELPAMVHREREVEVDIHHNIRGRFAPFKPDAELLLRDARPIDGTNYLSLSDVDIALHAMTHLTFGGDFADGLRDLLDIDVICRHFAAADATFWTRFSNRAGELNLALPAFYSLRYCSRILATPVPSTVFAALESARPAPLVLKTMDRLVPAALFPKHPEISGAGIELQRWLLYVRSHWVSMPPLMLLRHLSYKFYVRHFQWRFKK